MCRRIIERLVIAITAIVLAMLAWDALEDRQGKAQGAADARRDLQAGTIRLKGCGKPQYWLSDYQSLLMNRYDVEYEHVAGCMPNSFQSAYTFSYNETMKPTCEQRSIDFNRLRIEARSLAEARIHSH